MTTITTWSNVTSRQTDRWAYHLQCRWRRSKARERGVRERRRAAAGCQEWSSDESQWRWAGLVQTTRVAGLLTESGDHRRGQTLHQRNTQIEQNCSLETSIMCQILCATQKQYNKKQMAKQKWKLVLHKMRTILVAFCFFCSLKIIWRKAALLMVVLICLEVGYFEALCVLTIINMDCINWRFPINYLVVHLRYPIYKLAIVNESDDL